MVRFKISVEIIFEGFSNIRAQDRETDLIRRLIIFDNLSASQNTPYGNEFGSTEYECLVAYFVQYSF